MAKKILIIDDEPELVKAVEVRLKTSGYDIVTACEGSSGIQKAKEAKPDLILLDIIMPKMNGYQVAKKLMADPETQGIHIIVFSASQERDLENKCKELGITNFIMKPFETIDLLNMVKEVLEAD
jgi:CheY-like chemotaxis protein